ncbi:hypothetical protein M8C21_027384 [Ambrosia artemisiifolia]|uniref:Pectinesterase catalytic domain-containing protein n=1 Tax=Ambrosia artemisiifolia TaxID=4212 RepID=A0AAD5CAW4_AMBAR|nr:hypothetical protein M8C21_027384 [Ambrosia artemisiifolia]
MLVGDGIGKTIITGSKSVGGGVTTFKSATLDGFIGRGITVRNTAGPQNHQAVALRSGSDLSVPWQQYSRTVFMKTFLDGLVDPAGWMPWSGNFALNTLYYGEYMNTGPGSSTAKRVSWKGYRVITSATEAAKFTVGNFIAGSSWLPSTNVPFTSGL